MKESDGLYPGPYDPMLVNQTLAYFSIRAKENI